MGNTQDVIIHFTRATYTCGLVQETAVTTGTWLGSMRSVISLHSYVVAYHHSTMQRVCVVGVNEVSN